MTVPLPLVSHITSTTAESRALTACTDLDAGRLVIRVGPAKRPRFRGICTPPDVLDAISRELGVTLEDRKNPDTYQEWDAILGWLLSRRITELIVVDAQNLPTASPHFIASVMASIGVCTWFVTYRPLSPHSRAHYDNTMFQGATAADLSDHLRVRTGLDASEWPEHNRTAVKHWITRASNVRAHHNHCDTSSAEVDAETGANGAIPTLLPNVAYPVFLGLCEQLFTADQYHRIHEYVLTVARATADWLETQSGQNITFHDVHSWLDDVGKTCKTGGELLATVKAVQIILARGRYFTRIDASLLTGRLPFGPPGTFTQAEWARLAMYRQPARPALLALYAHGLTVNQLHDLTVDQISHDATEIATPDRTVHLTGHAAIAVNAQRVVRALQNPRTDALLFAAPNRDPELDTPIEMTFMAATLRRIQRHTGIAVGNAIGPSRSARWSRVLTITVNRF